MPFPSKPDLFTSRDWYGLVAQLEERLNGIEEVVSSILIGSTNSRYGGERLHMSNRDNDTVLQKVKESQPATGPAPF